MRKYLWRRAMAAALATCLLAGTCTVHALNSKTQPTNASVVKGASVVVLQLGNPKMIVDGMEMPVDNTNSSVTPIIIDGRTMLPLRAVCEALGCSVTWNAQTEVATVYYESSSVGFWINNKKIQINKQTVKNIDVAPVLVNGSTMLPVRYLEELGFVVDWDAQASSAVVCNPYSTNTLVVQSTGTTPIAADEAQGGTIISQYGNTSLVRYTSLQAAKNAQKAFASNRDISYAQPQRVLYNCAGTTSYVPSKIGASECLQKMDGLSSDNIVTVALLDTGVEWNNSAFVKRIARGEIDIVNGDGRADDDNGHGTQMAGILAELTPENIEILPVKVLNSQGRGTDTDIAEGIQYAVDAGADIIVLGCNETIPGAPASQPLAQAVAIARNKGIPVIAPAGNERVSTAWSVLSQISDVFTVSATDSTDGLYAYNNYGSQIFLSAPGVGINATTLHNSTAQVSGTSYSAAVVGGAAALYKLSQPGASYNDYLSFLQNNVADKGTAGRDQKYGYGVIDLTEFSKTVTGCGSASSQAESYVIYDTPVSVQKNKTVDLPIRINYKDGSYKDSTYQQLKKDGVDISVSIADEDIAEITSTYQLKGLSTGKSDVTVRYTVDGQSKSKTYTNGISCVTEDDTTTSLTGTLESLSTSTIKIKQNGTTKTYDLLDDYEDVVVKINGDTQDWSDLEDAYDDDMVFRVTIERNSGGEVRRIDAITGDTSGTLRNVDATDETVKIGSKTYDVRSSAVINIEGDDDSNLDDLEDFYDDEDSVEVCATLNSRDEVTYLYACSGDSDDEDDEDEDEKSGNITSITSSRIKVGGTSYSYVDDRTSRVKVDINDGSENTLEDWDDLEEAVNDDEKVISATITLNSDGEVTKITGYVKEVTGDIYTISTSSKYVRLSLNGNNTYYYKSNTSVDIDDKDYSDMEDLRDAYNDGDVDNLTLTLNSSGYITDIEVN